jgi:hypothetical protein
MAQSTEIKIKTSNVVYEYFTGSSQLANFFGLTLNEGEDQRRLHLTGRRHWQIILKALREYAKAFPGTKSSYMLTLIQEEKDFFDDTIKGNNSFIDDSPEFNLTVEILLTK